MAVKSVTHPQEAFAHLRTKAFSSRLNQIEAIRANGVGDLVALPQLVVCGDQSAGKSSVLEGITRIPFPRQDGLCTRFPTEIILRHQPNAENLTIKASIRPHVDRNYESRKLLEAWGRDIESMSELPAIINEVSKLMNIRGFSDFADACAFASDALRIEVSGPTGLHLSVVDLPGLISVSSEEQTEEDVKSVHEMVAAYLRSSRTIILAVLQATNDIANQPIIKLARQYDREGQRTVGILTKPDLINTGSEGKIASIAKNEDIIKLKLGYFLLKNPTPREIEEGITTSARSQRELDFFKSPRWAQERLDSQRIGVETLREFLQQLLDDHIEKELPKVREELKRILASVQAGLKDLGDARTDIADIRSFVTNLSMNFHSLFHAALEGNYSTVDSDFFKGESTRLRALVQEANTKYSAQMRDHGAKRKIVQRKASGSDVESANETTELIVSEKDMLQWVKEVYHATRGKELPGNHNPVLLAELFLEHSCRWHHLACVHIQTLLGIMSKWINKALDHLIREDALRREISFMLERRLDTAEHNALRELDLLTEDEKRGPLTYNHYYTDNVQKSRLDGRKNTVRNAIQMAMEDDYQGKLHVSNSAADIDRFMKTIDSHITVDMDEQACKEAQTELVAYYKVAMKTFTDNVARQVIERHIVSPLPSAFCPTSVSILSDDDLQRIGPEPAQQVTQREKLNSVAKGLRNSLSELQRPLYPSSGSQQSQ